QFGQSTNHIAQPAAGQGARPLGRSDKRAHKPLMPHAVTARRRRPPRLATKGRHGGLLVVSVSPSAKAPLRRALREAALLHRPAERVGHLVEANRAALVRQTGEELVKSLGAAEVREP